MKYLHTMVRVENIESSLDFYCNKLGLKEIRRVDHEKGETLDPTLFSKTGDFSAGEIVPDLSLDE